MPEESGGKDEGGRMKDEKNRRGVSADYADFTDCRKDEGGRMKDENGQRKRIELKDRFALPVPDAVG
jgi:hypothetical protein